MGLPAENIEGKGRAHPWPINIARWDRQDRLHTHRVELNAMDTPRFWLGLTARCSRPAAS